MVGLWAREESRGQFGEGLRRQGDEQEPYGEAPRECRFTHERCRSAHQLSAMIP